MCGGRRSTSASAAASAISGSRTIGGGGSGIASARTTARPSATPISDRQWRRNNPSPPSTGHAARTAQRAAAAPAGNAPIAALRSKRRARPGASARTSAASRHIADVLSGSLLEGVASGAGERSVRPRAAAHRRGDHGATIRNAALRVSPALTPEGGRLVSDSESRQGFYVLSADCEISGSLRNALGFEAVRPVKDAALAPA